MRPAAMLVALALAATLGAAPGAGAATGAAAGQVSTNWAGYVSSRSGGFRSVAGTWIVPAVDCTSVRPAYSADWVGLGGYREGAAALEQVGTEADCSSRGRPVYAAWWEIIPAGPVPIRIAVRPGDRVSASVKVSGRAVTLRLGDLATGARFSITRRVRRTDTSTAEWIVEAPSECSSGGRCRALAFADLGTTSFLAAEATAAGLTLPAGTWPVTPLRMRQPYVGPASPAQPAARSTLSGEPSALGAGGSFSVTWSLAPAQAPGPETPTLPGFSG